MNHVLIPGVIDQFGAFGPCLERFFYGDVTPSSHPSFPRDRPMAQSMYHKAYSPVVPEGIFTAANKIWQERQKTVGGDGWYGTSYLEACPSSWAVQRIGIGVVRHMANHIKFAKYHSMSAHSTNTFVERCWTDRRIEVSLPSLARTFSAHGESPATGQATNGHSQV